MSDDLRCPLCARPLVLGADTCQNCAAPLQYLPPGVTVLAWDRQHQCWVSRTVLEHPER